MPLNMPEKSARKRVYIIHRHLHPGGVERQLYYLLNGLVQHHIVHLLVCNNSGEFVNYIDKRVIINDLCIQNSHSNFGLFLRLLRLLKNEKPDVLVSFHGRLHWTSILAAKLSGNKVVCVFPGYMRKGALYLVHNLIFRMSDGLIAVAKSVQNSLVENFKLDRRKVSVIENAIDITKIRLLANEELAPDERLRFNTDNIMVAMGRLVKGKGFDTILDALADIRNNFTLVIIGDGPERKTLENKARALNLSSKVFFLGMQLNPYKYLHNARFFVHASESEGLPTVILEAMCLGVPCICVNYLGGTEGVISHKINGYLVNRNDPDDLRKAIELFLTSESKDMRDRFSDAGKTSIEEHFSLDQYIAKYMYYLDGVL